MTTPSPAERVALTLRMAELKARMDELRSSLDATTIPEWVVLYYERETIDRNMGDDPAEIPPHL